RPTTELYSLSLHDALPIWLLLAARGRPARGLPGRSRRREPVRDGRPDRRPLSPLARAARAGRRGGRGLQFALAARAGVAGVPVGDRKSTRLNSSHVSSSYA